MSENHPHYVWAFVAVIIVGVLAYVWSSNRPDVENYGKGSTHPEVTNNNYPLSMGFGGCMAVKPDGTLVRPMKGTHGTLTNSVAK